MISDKDFRKKQYLDKLIYPPVTPLANEREKEGEQVMSEKDVEIQILEAGKKLINPHLLAVNELLTLLDGVLICLKKVLSKKEALHPLLKALINRKLCSHPEVDVKLAVGACISEITRITAPDAPYDGRKMEKVFKLIVSLFKKSSFDNSTLSHSEILSKKTSILESLAKVRACVVMIDLHCNALIHAMIRNFLQDISCYYSPKVFSSMENIMTFILKETHGVRAEMLLPIIYYVRKDVEVPRESWRLAETVLSNCANKLRWDLPFVVQMSSVFIGNYRNIVAWICKEYDEDGHLKLPGVEEEDSGVDLTKEQEDSEDHFTKVGYPRYSRRSDQRAYEGEGGVSKLQIIKDMRKHNRKIVEAGEKLIDPACSVDELLTRLDRVLICLKSVKDDFLKDLMKESVYLLKKILMNGKLCRHSEFDVKVAVAACISEIARIVAPDPPFAFGRKNEEAFELIVSTFKEPLVDKATPSYSKTLSRRTSILKSLYKAGQMGDRNFNVLNDFDLLNVEMSKNFLKAISIRYPSNVFPYMAKILTLVLEGKDPIRPRMLFPFLYYVREDVKVPQASRRLAEKVLSNCADRLKTYLPRAVRLSGVPTENYSKIVVSICCPPPLQEHQLVVTS